jgi:hypothetical protein
MHHISLGHVAGAFGRWRDAVAQEVKVEQYAAASSQERGVAVLLRHLKYCRRRRVKMKEVLLYIYITQWFITTARASPLLSSTPTHPSLRSYYTPNYPGGRALP